MAWSAARAVEEAAAHGGPVLLAGPTASGKSGLAAEIARRAGGAIVNADALQVYAHWRVLTARPSAAEEAALPHRLYGHVAPGRDWSVGHWLRAVAALPSRPRPIVVGGTGLYFTALTEGLAAIPPTPPAIRARADARLAAEGPGALLAEIDRETRARLDPRNPARIQRAWEVQEATGRGLAAWQSRAAPPLLPESAALCLVIEAPPERLNPRISARFDAMLAGGALDEVRRNADRFDPARPCDRAIGARELLSHLRGETDLETARMAAIVSTRQYAKRQRTWFRNRMPAWHRVDPFA